MIPITVFTPQNAYKYHPRNLIISYGSGVIATAASVAIGFICISKAPSQTFGTSFSTIMRTTRNHKLDSLVSSAETSGAEPLPEQLAVTKFRLVRARRPAAVEGTSGSGTDAEDAIEASGEEWTFFSVVGDETGSELRSAKGKKWKRPVDSETDVDLLLVRGE